MTRFSDLPVEMTQRIASMADTASILALRLTNKETDQKIFATFVERCLEDLRIGGSQLALERATEFLGKIESVKSVIGKKAVTFVSSDRYLGLKRNYKCTARSAHIAAVLNLLPKIESLTIRNDTVAMPRATDTWDGGVIIDTKDRWLKQREIKTRDFDTEVVSALSYTHVPWLSHLTLEGVTIASSVLQPAIENLSGSIEYACIRHVELQWGSFTDILQEIYWNWAGKLKRFIIDTVYDRASEICEYNVVPLDILVRWTGKRQEYAWSAPKDPRSLDGQGPDEMQEIWLWRTRGSMKGRYAVETGLEIMLEGRW